MVHTEFESNHKTLPDGTIIYPDEIRKATEPRRTRCTEVSPTQLIVIVCWDDECVITFPSNALYEALESQWVTVRAYGTSRSFTIRTDQINRVIEVRGIEEAHAVASFHYPMPGSDCTRLSSSHAST